MHALLHLITDLHLSLTGVSRFYSGGQTRITAFRYRATALLSLPRS